MPSEDQNIFRRLKFFKKHKRYGDVKDIAARLGMHRVFVSNVISGKVEASEDTLEKIVKAGEAILRGRSQAHKEISEAINPDQDNQD